MPLNNLNPYAHFRCWQQAAETSPDTQPGPALTGAQVWVVHFSGQDWEGPFDRAAYLCLTLAEAQMVVGGVAGPMPKVSRLGFDAYINARIEAVALAQVLQEEALKPLLQRRLKRLAAHPPEAYEAADQRFLCLHEGGVAVLLLAGGQLVPPGHPGDDWPKELRWGEPLVVWNDEGKAGVMGPEGQLWVPCQFAALRSGLSGKRLLALREPVAHIQEPITPRAYLQFRCDVIDNHTGQCVNPIGTSALLGSLGHQGEFVAVMEGEANAQGTPSMGFMDCDGQWLGGCRWAGVLLFHEGMAAVQDRQTLQWGYLNMQGQVAIATQYAWPGFFNRKRAIVQTALPTGTQPVGDEAAQWLLIDPTGTTISGPWAHIDHAASDHFVVQALPDAGSTVWSLIDERGAKLVERESVPPCKELHESALDTSEQAAKHLSALWQTRRRSLAQQLRGLPPVERVARYQPRTERDLAHLGLWGQRVRCTRPVKSVAMGTVAEPVGTIECHYPVSLSIFGLAVEAPVTFVRTDGSTVCIGVPWDGLELVSGESERLAKGQC